MRYVVGAVHMGFGRSTLLATKAVILLTGNQSMYSKQTAVGLPEDAFLPISRLFKTLHPADKFAVRRAQQ